ncbi:MAG: 2OG-Fe(II) oxygenase [Hyphomicrobiales bacterium]
MPFPPLPDLTEVADHFAGALSRAKRSDTPYRHWLLSNVFPEQLCVGILTLPIAPPLFEDCEGVRDTQNDKRTFITPQLRSRFPVCEVLAEALQRPEIARLFAETCDIDLSGAHLRTEYIQDLDGAWLKPHRDIPEKLFSMVIYLCTGPDAKDWGTDIYDAELRQVGRSSATFNSAVIFVPGPNTWHGFDRRPINGVRRLMEVNYVRSDWRDRDQLAFPDKPIRAQ